MKGCQRSTVIVLRILNVNVNVTNGALENADLGAVAAGLKHEGLVLDADDLSDNTADGGDLIANHKAVTHRSNFLFLLLLRSDHEEVEKNEHRCDHSERDPVETAGFGGLFKQSDHFDPPVYIDCFHYNPNGEGMQHKIVNILSRGALFSPKEDYK